MRFLADENFPLASVRMLRIAGHDVAAVVEDSPGVGDDEVLARAAREQRVLLTFDRDYGELIFHTRYRPPAGIVYLRFPPASPGEPARWIPRLLKAEGIALEGHLTVIDLSRVRQRPLPRPIREDA